MKKATGPGEISPRVLKEAADEFAPILTFIFNQLFNSAQIPDNWKSVNICPLHTWRVRSQGVLSRECWLCPRLVAEHQRTRKQVLQYSESLYLALQRVHRRIYNLQSRLFHPHRTRASLNSTTANGFTAFVNVESAKSSIGRESVRIASFAILAILNRGYIRCLQADLSQISHTGPQCHCAVSWRKSRR